MLAANESAYGQAFLKRFSDRVTYPSEALEAGQSGAVQLCALLSRDGVVHGGRIDAGSGFPLLDGAALLALGGLKHAKEAAPLPQDLAPGQQQVWLAFSVNFKPDRAGVRLQEAQDDRPCKNTGTKEGDLNSGAVTSDEWNGFPAEFSDAVKKRLIYPKLALDDGESGYTLLCVSLDRDSHLLGVAISQSSGSPMLDGASLIALGMLQLKTEIPYIPDRVRQTHDTITFTQEIDWTQPKPQP
ncbi:MAG: energy transducer TonB [Nevskiales bacterium]